MRKLEKEDSPIVLRDNFSEWTRKYLESPDIDYRKYRYRHEDIKSALKNETGEKCIYCESKIGHNCPGDIEHKVPTSKCPHLHFDWNNLTIACTECNRRKNDYYSIDDGFIDPYLDDVEIMLEHNGPIVSWATGCQRAEASIRTLELHSSRRMDLIVRKIEKIESLRNLLERIDGFDSQIMKDLLINEVRNMADSKSEFSAMVKSILIAKGFTAD